MKTALVKLAFSLAAACAAGAVQAGVIVSAYTSAPLLTTKNFDRPALNLNLPVWQVANGATSLLAFCIEPTVSLFTSRTDYAPSAFSFANAAGNKDGRIERLYSLYYPTVTGTSADAKATALSFQLALWELYNDDASLSTGSLKVSSAMNPRADVKSLINAAGTMLTRAKDTSVAIDKRYVFTSYASAGSQTIVSAVEASAVPEPAGIAMLGLGAGVMALVRRRRTGRA